jgi:hypothetical protein
MSTIHVEAALKIELRAAPKAVLMALAYHTNEFSGVAWPGFTRLGKWTGLDERSIRRCIKEIETAGLLTVKRGTGRTSSVYTLTLPDAAATDITDQKRLPPEALNPGGAQSPPSQAVPPGRAESPPREDSAPPKSNERIQDASDARAIDEDWRPKQSTIERIAKDDGLTGDDLERELRLFVLKNLEAGTPLRNPDAAFRTWCARLATLNHAPKKPPPKKAAAVERTPLEQARHMVEVLEGKARLYQRMGRTHELQHDVNPSLKTWREELARCEAEARIAA